MWVFLREYIKKTYDRSVDEIIDHHEGSDHDVVEAFIEKFQKATVAKKRGMLQELKDNQSEAHFTKREKKSLKKVYRRELVKRSALIRIAAAWLITVPASAALAALIFYTIRGAMLP